MQIFSNRYLIMGLIMALLTAATAAAGTPLGIQEFTVPIWDILFQFNLCSSFVFAIVGVLQSSEIAIPDLRGPLQMFMAAFCTYVVVCLSGPVGLEMTIAVKLFLFALSTACIVAGWGLTGIAALRQLDSQR